MPETSLELPISRALREHRCAAQHFGAWAIEPKWFASAMDAVKSGRWQPRADAGDGEEEADHKLYQLVDGIAIISIDGQMTKRGSSFGGCSTIKVREAVRAAAADWMVKAILMHICSPGGTCAGTADLAQDVWAAREKKPVHAYLADMGCSAAYWVASQCESIRANVTAVVGSIGTYTMLVDDTKWQEEMGVKWQVVASAEFKGLGADGKVEDKLVADVHREIMELNAPFLAAVKRGRGSRIGAIEPLADGRVHVGEQAKQLGLIDDVSTLDAAMQAIRKELRMPENPVSAFAAQHPEAVKAWKDEGYSQAKSELNKPASVDELEKAFSGESEFILGQLKAGATMAAAAVAFTGIQKTRDKAAAEQSAKVQAEKDKTIADQATAIAAKDKEIGELKAKVEFASTGQRPLSTAGVKGGENPAPDGDPKETAKAEWAANKDACKSHFVNESAYVGYRTAELRGGVSMTKPQ